MDIDVPRPSTPVPTAPAVAAYDDDDDDDVISLDFQGDTDAITRLSSDSAEDAIVNVEPKHSGDSSGHVSNESSIEGLPGATVNDCSEDGAIGDGIHVTVDECLLEKLSDAFVFRYGFCEQDVTDFRFSSQAQNYSRDTLDKVMQIYVHRNEVVPRRFHMPIIDFANIVVTNHQIESGTLTGNVVSLGNLWDLSVNSPHRLPFPHSQTENQLPSALRIRPVTCATTGRLLYIITEMKKTSKFAFDLVVEQATTAVECYRRDWQSVLSVGKDLTQLGKAFRTYIPRDSQFTGPSRSRTCEPLAYRSRRHVFRLTDYSAYEDMRQEFLEKPFARAAVLVGGIIWRLAVDTIGAEVALRGPSTHAHEFGDLVTDPSGKQFVDDALSDEEMDLICGKYIIYTGQAMQTARKWWWPPHSTWIKGSLHVGYWTQQCERWYQDRLVAIKSREAQPLTRNEWKVCLRRSHHTCPFVEAIEMASSNYFRYRYYH